MEQERYIKEAISILEDINKLIVNKHFSTLEFEITPKQFLILKAVRGEQPVNIHTVASRYDFSMSSTSQLVNKLENEGYIIRSINPKNRREIILTLGERGEKFWESYDRIDVLVTERYYSKLSVEETVQLRDFAKKLYGIITGE
ncbi:MarR family transcriptional regulator [Bacillus sp. E(2018)]|uniref:MarR family winged helix-turn-helix transcriptional regulator n=1 Tax=Bacillus sp. E(2018) TaxID=2502239 RepID=UPI0010F5D2CB|nr:MarR family transcriptional regulator [Bacillus sp. E(2018)]